MISKRLNDLQATFALNKETILRLFDNSKGQPHIPTDDAKLILLTLLANSEIQLSMIQELNDLQVAQKKFGFIRLFKK